MEAKGTKGKLACKAGTTGKSAEASNATIITVRYRPADVNAACCVFIVLPANDGRRAWSAKGTLKSQARASAGLNVDQLPWQREHPAHDQCLPIPLTVLPLKG